MSRLVGTVSRGIRAPIIREGDDIAKLVTESVLAASEDEEWGFRIRNGWFGSRRVDGQDRRRPFPQCIRALDRRR